MLEATYTKPYMAHASIGPSAAVAEFKDDKCTVWTHSQGVFPLRAELAKALKVPPAAVRCIHTEGSGCYGHNGADDVALDAALLARARAGPAGAAAMDARRRVRLGAVTAPRWRCRRKASLDAEGRIVDWNYERVEQLALDAAAVDHAARTCSPPGISPSRSKMGPPTSPPQPAGGGDRNAIPLYDFPNQKVVHHFIQDMPIRVSALRTLGAYANVFAGESFMDELALAAGADPVAFRLAHLKDPRARAVIEKVAEIAGWKAGEKGDGARGRGIGFSKYKNLACYCAVVADVEVDRASGRVRVTRACAAVDAGLIINPDGLIQQIEGGIIQSASWTLHEEVKFDAERHPVARLVELSDPDHAGGPEGRGRADQPAGRARARRRRRLARPAVAAIANAFAHATGKRVRDLPFHPGAREGRAGLERDASQKPVGAVSSEHVGTGPRRSRRRCA